MKTASALLVMFLIGTAAGYLIFSLGGNPSSVNHNALVRRDTIIKLVESEPIVIEKHVPRVVFKRDSVIETRPFTAIVDTLVRRDTVRAVYEFPENTFSMRISRGVDSLAVEQVQVIDYSDKVTHWWHVPAYVLAGVIVGFIIGNN